MGVESCSEAVLNGVFRADQPEHILNGTKGRNYGYHKEKQK